jgi:hypothetical protein
MSVMVMSVTIMVMSVMVTVMVMPVTITVMVMSVMLVMLMQRDFDIHALAVAAGDGSDELPQRGDGSAFFTDQTTGYRRVATDAQACAPTAA